MTYRFLSPAEQDLAEAVSYYELAERGLGLAFLDEVERTLRRILLNPLAWTKVSENHRRCRTRRFPFGLIYTIEEETIVVSAVMHLSRHPDWWKSRT